MEIEVFRKQGDDTRAITTGDVDCPTCKAEPGSDCTKPGYPRPQYHVARGRIAAAADGARRNRLRRAIGQTR